MEGRGCIPIRPRIRQARIQHRQSSQVHVRLPSSGPCHRLFADRFRCPIQKDERVQCVLPPLLRRQRHADRGPSGEEARHNQIRPPTQGIQEALLRFRQRLHRGDEAPLRDTRGEHGPEHILPDRRHLLQEDNPDLLREALQNGIGLQRQLPGQLVPEMHDGTGRCGGRVQGKPGQAQLHQVQHRGRGRACPHSYHKARAPVHMQDGGGSPGRQEQVRPHRQESHHSRLREKGTGHIRSEGRPRIRDRERHDLHHRRQG